VADEAQDADGEGTVRATRRRLAPREQGRNKAGQATEIAVTFMMAAVILV
jgi:hypothetical protein